MLHTEAKPWLHLVPWKNSVSRTSGSRIFSSSRLEFRYLRLSALKLSTRTMRRVWTSQKFVARSLSRPWPPLWLTFWLHCHSHISLTQNNILIFQIALISSLSLEWKWGSWVTVRDSDFQWILKTLQHCKSNNTSEISLCFPAVIFKQIFFLLCISFGITIVGFYSFAGESWQKILRHELKRTLAPGLSAVFFSVLLGLSIIESQQL